MYDACAGEVWTEGGFTLALFPGWGMGSEVLLEQMQLSFSFRKTFIILLLCGAFQQTTTRFKKCAFLEVLLVMVVMKTEMRIF